MNKGIQTRASLSSHETVAISWSGTVGIGFCLEEKQFVLLSSNFCYMYCIKYREQQLEQLFYSYYRFYYMTCIIRSVIESNSQPQEQSGESSWWRLWEVTVVTWPQWVDLRVGLTPPIYLRRMSTSPCSGFVFIADYHSHYSSVVCYYKTHTKYHDYQIDLYR